MKASECSGDCKSTTGYKYKSVYHHDENTYISFTKMNFIHERTKGSHLKCKYQLLVELKKTLCQQCGKTQEKLYPPKRQLDLKTSEDL